MFLFPVDESKVLYHEVLCLCGEISCTKFNCSSIKIKECRYVTNEFTFADVLKKKNSLKNGVGKNTSRNRIVNRNIKGKLLNLKYDSIDNQLNCFQTFIGHTHDRELYEIVSELENNFFGEISNKPLNVKILDLKRFVLNKNKKSKIGNFTNNELVVNTAIRNSLSLTFGHETVEKLSTILKPKLIESIGYTSEVIEEIRFEPTHGNLLLYQEGGKFDVHRDKELKFPFEDEEKDTPDYIWEMYSMVFCLETNLMDRFASDEGNTIVYLPPWSSQNGAKIIDEDYHLVKLAPHVFNQSVIQGSFVAFPSLARHSSVEIQTPGKEKFALKMDFWVKTKKKIGDYYHDDRFFNYLSIPTNNISQNTFFRCNCKLCDNVSHRFQSFIMKTLTKKLPYYLAKLAMEFIDVFDFLDFEYEVDNNSMGFCETERKLVKSNRTNQEYLDIELLYREYNEYERGYDSDEYDRYDDRYCNGDEW